jgi:hypothetical protein
MGTSHEDVCNKIRYARAASRILNSALWDRNVSINTRKQIYPSVIIYGAELWAINEDTLKSSVP